MFEFLHKYEIPKDITAKFKIPFIGKDLNFVLIVRPAIAEHNSAYLNEIDRVTIKRLKDVDGKTSDRGPFQIKVEEHRNLIPIYAKTIVVGWEGVHDTDGNEVPFTAQHAQELLQQVPTDAYKLLVRFCESRENFLLPDVLTEAEAEVAAKN